jgi:serine/threonine protein kinase
MHKQRVLLALEDIVQNRYVIKAILGEGGFSAVYLVRDLQASDKDDEAQSLFALKELHYQSHQEKARFDFEGEILKKLSHPSLPRFYRIVEDRSHFQEFMLLEYIQGSNLEVLRRQQPDQRFALSRMLTIIKPIVDAITYLHHQQPPVMHRDVKPSNIIASDTAKGAVLVDFGIAKEYETDATTTAIRHCSPGYGAPEQYSGYGTDPRTDIYGLGATCYALLTGTIPVDAFHRATTLASQKTDPLVPVNALVADVPTHVAQAIERAMSISQEGRFSTAEDFWLALNTPSTELSFQTSNVNPSSHASQQKGHQQMQIQAHYPQPGKSVLSISLCLVFLIIVGGGLGFWSHTRNNHLNTSTASRHASPLTITPSPPEANSYPHIKSTYQGTIHDLSAERSTEMSLMKINQQNESISGSFTGLHMLESFTGVLDSSKHIFFTVKGNASHSSIFFEGAVRSDGNLAGNYCNVDQMGQCTGNYGLWSVTPVAS